MKKTLLRLLFLIFFLLQIGTLSFAQLHPTSVFDSPPTTWTVSVGGQYSELMWQDKNIQTYDRQVRALVGYSLLKSVKLCGLFGYSNFNYKQTGISDIHFDQDYALGGNILIGPFNLRPDKITVSWTLFGEWFNPYKKRDKLSSINQDDWNESQEYLLESIKGGMSVNFTLRTKKFDFFAGPVFSKNHLTLKHQATIGGESYSYQLDQFAKTYNSDVVVGIMFGVGVRLPGRYYLNMEIRNDNLNEFITLFSIAQFGSP